MFTSKHPRKTRSGLRFGGAVLDAALVLPILLSLTFGTVEYGHYFFVKHAMQGAAREGARAAITPSATNATVTAAVNSSMSAAGFNSSVYTVSIRNATDTANLNVSGLAAGTGILVKVSCTWGTVGLRPLGLIGSNKQVVGMTTMRKEG